MKAKILYHCTTEDNMESITKKGLIPQIGERAKKLGETKKRIYLFPSYEDCETALESWLGEEFDEDKIVVTLRVTLPANFPLEDSTVSYEKIARRPIPAKYISFYKYEG